MNWKCFGTKIGKNYAWEMEWFCFHRMLIEGFTPIKFGVEYDYYIGDHKPSFEVELVLFNFTIFHFTIYNIWHCNDLRSPMYLKYIKEEDEEDGAYQ